MACAGRLRLTDTNLIEPHPAFIAIENYARPAHETRFVAALQTTARCAGATWPPR